MQRSLLFDSQEQSFKNFYSKLYGHIYTRGYGNVVSVGTNRDAAATVQ